MHDNSQTFSCRSYRVIRSRIDDLTSTMNCLGNGVTLSQRTSRFSLPFDLKQLESNYRDFLPRQCKSRRCFSFNSYGIFGEIFSC